MTFNERIISKAKELGAVFVRLADISELGSALNQNYPYAVVLGIPLSHQYLENILTLPDYIEEKIRLGQMEEDEFDLKEKLMDEIADVFAAFLVTEGWLAFSQSEKNLMDHGLYHRGTKTSNLPHKTIARIAGMGWIGKNDLLVTSEYGCAISMCTVLTNAPLHVAPPADPVSQCGSCSTCKESCPQGIITGQTWNVQSTREDLVDIYNCTTCLRCLAFCPYSRAYMNQDL